MQLKTRIIIVCGILALTALTVAQTLGLFERGTTTSPASAMPAIGGPFDLIDQRGVTVTDAAFRGAWMLVYFGYTHCPDACPTALNSMALALDDLGPARADIRPIFITVDPERDTPEVLRAYLDAFGGGIIGLTGTPDRIKEAERVYRVYAAKHAAATGADYEMDHSSIIYLMDPHGRFVASFTHETTPDAITRKLRDLIH